MNGRASNGIGRGVISAYQKFVVAASGAGGQAGAARSILFRYFRFRSGSCRIGGKLRADGRRSTGRAALPLGGKGMHSGTVPEAREQVSIVLHLSALGAAGVEILGIGLP